MKKRIFSILLAVSLLFSAVSPAQVSAAKKAKDEEVESIVESDEEMRAMWVSVYDFAPLGLKKKGKAAFKQSVKQFMKKMDNAGINVLFWHVRANDDAFWASDTFPAISQFAGSSAGVASDVYRFDPLEVVVDAAHARDIELHAWINPYRVNASVYMDPGLPQSQKRVKKAVTELLEYDIDGVHMDDYFYHATGGYCSPANRGAAYPISLTAAQKCANVNKLVKALYKKCHKEDVVFGISPQANLDNDLASGADVPTWLSRNGYVDYVAPQVYWTDSAGSQLFSTRLAQFLSLRHNSAKFYVGLALYRAGTSSDPGWRQRNDNLAYQVKKLRQSGADGFILFSAQYLFSPQAVSEVQNLAPLMRD